MELKDTVSMMNNTDYKERFKAEYFQLQNRINSLDTMLDKYRKGTLSFEPKCSIKLLDGQMRAMVAYKTHLEERARIECIDLIEVVKEQPTEQSKETTK